VGLYNKDKPGSKGDRNLLGTQEYHVDGPHNKTENSHCTETSGTLSSQSTAGFESSWGHRSAITREDDAAS
jgi:hypothetical protein